MGESRLQAFNVVFQSTLKYLAYIGIDRYLDKKDMRRMKAEYKKGYT